MLAIKAIGYAQMIQAWTQDPPLKKRESDASTHTNGQQQSVNILLGVIFGVAIFFVLTMVYVAFSHII
jgi:hypothetical protein